MKKAIAALAAVVLLLSMSACGGSSKDSDKKDAMSAKEKKVVKTIADSFSQQAAGALTEKEADCFATKFVAGVGVDKMVKAKLVNADGTLNKEGATFDKDISGSFADSFLACVDYQARQAQEIAKTDTKVDEAKLRDCLEEKMPDSFVHDLIVSAQVQGEDSAKLIQQSTKILTGCKKTAAKS